MTRKLSISTAWDETKAIMGRDGNLILAVTLALVVLPQMLAGLAEPQTETARQMSAMGSFLFIAAAAVSLIGQLAIVRLAIGPSTSVGEAIGHGARRFLPTFAALFLFGLAMAAVLVPLVILLLAAGIVTGDASSPESLEGFSGLLLVVLILMLAISVRFVLITPIGSAERIGPIRILRRSWELSKGHYLRLLGFLVLVLVMAGVLLLAAQAIGGSLATLIGGAFEPFSLAALIVALFVAFAQGVFSLITSVMLARIYVHLAGDESAEVSVPSSGT